MNNKTNKQTKKQKTRGQNRCHLGRGWYQWVRGGKRKLNMVQILCTCEYKWKNETR
jgi:hypothetical protein